MALIDCPQCGQKVLSIASSCPKCGYQIGQQRSQLQRRGVSTSCRNCEQDVSARARVCPHCGVRNPGRRVRWWLAAVVGAALVATFTIPALWTRMGSNATLSPSPETETAVLPETSVTVVETTPPPTEAAQPVAPPAPIDAQLGPAPGPDAQLRWTLTWVNVRDARSPESEVVRVLNPGERVTVGDRARGWWMVYIDGAAVGYVANSVLDTIAPDSLPPVPQ